MRPPLRLLLFPILLFSPILITNQAPVPGCIHDNSQAPPPKKARVDPGPRCNMLISEIKLAQNVEDDCLPFIELKTNCAKRPGPIPKNPLANYKMVILRGQPLQFVLVLDFASIPYQDGKQFLVIGSPKLQNIDVSLGTTHVQSTFSTTVDQNMLPLQGEGPYTLLLLRDIPRNEGKEFNLWYTHDGPALAKAVTTQQVKLMKTHVVDMLVFGLEDEIKRNEFSYFWKPIINNPQSHLFTTSWNELQKAGTSLNVCGETYNGFDTSSFLVKPQSPGEQNRCIDEDPNNREGHDEISNQQQCNPTCHFVSTSKLLAAQQPFNPGFIEACKGFFPKDDMTTRTSAVQEWLRFDTDPMCKFYCNACKTYFDLGFRPDVKVKTNIMKTGYYSTNIYRNRDAIKNHQEHKVHSEAMEFYERLKESAHDEEMQHKLIAEFESRERVTFNATMNVVLFLYAEMKSGLSFKTHEALMTALRLIGANVGFLHHTDDSAQGITKLIAGTLHNDLLITLVAGQQPFAILADSSTTGSQPYLAVYFQTIDTNEYPVTYFYSLVHMSKGEKARDMVNSLIDQIKTDDMAVHGFENYFKSKLTSISSDGASVMTGNIKSFRVFIIEYIGRPIPNVVCLAHNLDRAYKVGIQHNKEKVKGIKERIKNKKATAVDHMTLWHLTYFEDFDKFIKKIYTYYRSRGHKKWQHFVRSADALDEIPKSMKYPYDIRWSETLYESILAVHNNHYILVYDVDEISEDEDFDESCQETAVEIHQRLTDKTFLFALHDLLDILSTFKKASKIFQTASSTVTGKVVPVYNILEALENYKEKPGEWLQGFLGNVVCTGVCDDGKCSLDAVDSCEETIIRGMRIQHQYPGIIPYAEVRDILFVNLLSSIKKYFKLEMLEAFEIFNPERLLFQHPVECQQQVVEQIHSVSSIEDHYTIKESHKKHYVYTTFYDRLDYICRFYYFNETINCAQLIGEWNILLGCITSNGDLRDIKEKDATVFWPMALSVCSKNWSFLTRKLVQFVLVTSYTSSECERGFSIMNAIKTKTRSSLDKTTVDALMKVKINGPDLKDFRAYEMTVQVLKVYARVDDEDFHNPKRSTSANI